VVVTHTDADHVGALEAVLEAAPEARVLTNYLGMGKLMMRGAIAPERFHLVNPGQRHFIGDRRLAFLRPPTYDAPETMAVYDPKNGALFSSDCFGALMDEPKLDLREVEDGALRDGMVTWTTVDAPWLSKVKRESFTAALRQITSLSPDLILGAHLPVARGVTERLCRNLEDARRAEPFVGPDQAALAAAAE
jgi:flavorubredoxin